MVDSGREDFGFLVVELTEARRRSRALASLRRLLPCDLDARDTTQARPDAGLRQESEPLLQVAHLVVKAVPGDDLLAYPAPSESGLCRLVHKFPGNLLYHAQHVRGLVPREDLDDGALGAFLLARGIELVRGTNRGWHVVWHDEDGVGFRRRVRRLRLVRLLRAVQDTMRRQNAHLARAVFGEQSEAEDAAVHKVSLGAPEAETRLVDRRKLVLLAFRVHCHGGDGPGCHEKRGGKVIEPAAPAIGRCLAEEQRLGRACTGGSRGRVLPRRPLQAFKDRAPPGRVGGVPHVQQHQVLELRAAGLDGQELGPEPERQLRGGGGPDEVSPRAAWSVYVESQGLVRHGEHSKHRVGALGLGKHLDCADRWRVVSCSGVQRGCGVFTGADWTEGPCSTTKPPQETGLRHRRRPKGPGLRLEALAILLDEQRKDPPTFRHDNEYHAYEARPRVRCRGHDNGRRLPQG
mmetsp:Transcript_8170/g.20508  ORF Transcript_8170/g.20508 Transcript_8170/m.20508 type:complete len:462 (-) Transcript_8170:607-1992(-)